MANIYQLSETLQACIKLDEQRMVDTETGEILDVDQYLALAEALDAKLENLALYIKNQQAEANMIKAEADILAKRAKAKANEAERCKDRLSNFMANNYDGEKFETARVRLSWRSSESVEVNGIDALPDEYLRFKDPEPDKTKIKAALKAGVELKGCTLVANQNLQIK